MPATVSIEIPADREQFFRRILAFTEELDQLALSAPDGTVFDACETAVITKGREVQKQMLEDAVARRIESAEKRGHRSESASVAVRKKTVVRNPGPC
jgi:hypothetical protein